MEARDWSGLGALIAPEAVIDWPATGERIVGRSAFVAVNREYPEGWSIRVLDVFADPAGERVVSEVEVPQEGVGVFRAVSFWTVRGGLVVAGTEYWTTVGGESAPAWRAPWTRSMPR
ncbi:nuclear transport factor 2 family protein [Streptomyces sp. ST2-7A]|nr:nuclear transport factor 2 family protein [Streptomyces sp. ST2-7A]